MILEEETFKAFGYYPSELKPKSNKKIFAACDGCGKIRELCKGDYRSLCLSCSRKGEKNPMFGRTGEKCPAYGRTGARNPMWGKRGDKSPRFGKHHSEETKKKIRSSEYHRNLNGKNHPNYGKHLSEEAKQKIREAHLDTHPSEATRKKIRNGNKGKSVSEETRRKLREAGKKRFEKEEEREKIREARKHQRFPQHHTKPERIFIDLYRLFNINDRVECTSNNSFHIGRLNPDFILRDMRIAIFINGDYWHSALLRPNLRDTQQPKFQIAECKKHKWKAVILWESDLEREDAEAFVLNLLKKEGVIK